MSIWTISNALRLLAILVLLFGSKQALATDLTGLASVVDGDTIEIHGTRIRLFGIDAPESGQFCRGSDSLSYRCGAIAANKLDAFIERRQVSCSPLNRDKYGRLVAICFVGGLDISAWLVRSGLAVDWPKYSRGKYSKAQAEAEEAERGIWQGSFSKPWAYRDCMRAGNSAQTCSEE